MDSKTSEPGEQQPATTAQDGAMTDGQSVADMKDMKLVVMDSAELATRAASLAANAGLDLRNATKDLLHGSQALLQGNKRQSKMSMILVAVAGSLMLVAGIMFVVMSLRLQSRVAQLDEMVLAVGKRAVDLKRRMETMDDIHASLEELNLKQENTQSVQQAIEDKIAS